MTMAPPSFLFRGSWPKVSRNTAVLRREIVGGAQASNSTTMPMALRMCTTEPSGRRDKRSWLFIL